MATTMIRVDEEIAARLREQAQIEDRSLIAVVNRVLREYIERLKPKIDPVKQKKAMRAVRVALNHGDLVRLPCEVCGTEEIAAQAHHDDYDHPLDVRWLCPSHHKKFHGAFGRPGQ